MKAKKEERKGCFFVHFIFKIWSGLKLLQMTVKATSQFSGSGAAPNHNYEASHEIFTSSF